MYTNNKGVANSFYALGLLKNSTTDLPNNTLKFLRHAFDCLVVALPSIVLHMRPQELANTCWSFVQLQQKDPAVLGPLSRAIGRSINGKGKDGWALQGIAT